MESRFRNHIFAVWLIAILGFLFAVPQIATITAAEPYENSGKHTRSTPWDVPNPIAPSMIPHDYRESPDGKGYRYTMNGWIYVHIEGDPYERGYQHGYLVADEILNNIMRWQAVVPAYFGVTWDKWESIAVTYLWPYWPEEYQVEVQGITDGVNDAKGNNVVTWKNILAYNSGFELWMLYYAWNDNPFWEDPKVEIAEVHHCSSFIASGRAATEGQIVAAQNTWLPWYIGEGWNEMLDVVPTEGYRTVCPTSPGYVFSDEDWWINDQGMILMETTLGQGEWRTEGIPMFLRARIAMQYSDSIDELFYYLEYEQNGVSPNDWLVGDVKTGEIGHMEEGYPIVATERWSLPEGCYYWSCNNAKDPTVRVEIGMTPDWEWVDRDYAFYDWGQKYYGEIDIEVGKLIMGKDPITLWAFDNKIVDSSGLEDGKLQFWAYMGNPDGDWWFPSREEYATWPGLTVMPAYGWTFFDSKSPRNVIFAEMYDYILGLSNDAFSGPADQLRDALTNKLEQVGQWINEGKYAKAIRKLRNDIAPKVGKDWITDPEAQAYLLEMIEALIDTFPE